MRSFLASIALALIASTAGAQFDVSIIPQSSRAVIDFKDQFSNSVTKGGVGVAFQITPTAMQPPANSTGLVPLRLRYSYTPPTGGETNLMWPSRLIVDGVDFSVTKDSSTSANRKEDEPVVIEWSVKAAHSLEVEAGQFGILRPLIAIEAIKGSVTATGKPKDKTEVITATEDFSGTFVAFGARARSFAGKDLWVDAGIALGSGYEHAEVSANMQIARDIFVAGGYRHRVLRFSDGITVRRGDVFGEVGVRFKEIQWLHDYLFQRIRVAP